MSGAATKADEKPITKTELIASLRNIEQLLYYGPDVVEKVKGRPLKEQAAFRGARLNLSATIALLNATLMGEIRQQLEPQSKLLRLGIGGLEKGLKSVKGVTLWVGVVDKIIGVIGKAVPLLSGVGGPPRKI